MIPINYSIAPCQFLKLMCTKYERFCGRKCLLLLLGVVGLTSALFLAIVFLVNTDLTVKNNDFASFLPQCSPIDTNQLWKSDTQKVVNRVVLTIFTMRKIR